MQRFYANDGATWRDARIIYVNDGSSWRKVRDAFVYDGQWRSIYHDKNWIQIPSSGSAVGTLCGSIWSDTFAFAISGTVYAYAGTTLSNLGAPGGATIYGLAVVSSGDTLIASDGTACHFWNGSAWSNIGGPAVARGVWPGPVSGTAYASDVSGNVQYYNGSSWAAVSGPSFVYEISSNTSETWCISGTSTLYSISGTTATSHGTFTSPADPLLSIYVATDNTPYMAGTFGLWYWNGSSLTRMDTADCRFISEDDRGDIVYGRSTNYVLNRVNPMQTSSNRCILALDSGTITSATAYGSLVRTSTGRMAMKVRISSVNYVYIWADR